MGYHSNFNKLVILPRYSTDADVCIIELKPGIPEDSIDLKEGVILHLDKDGKPIEIEIIDASKFVSLDEITFSLPKVKLPKAIQSASARHS